MQRFTQQHRLRTADDFSSVFLFRRVLYGGFIKIHYKPNTLSHSRLGLIVGKRVHKKANKRNYMKRALREFFRVHQHKWGSVQSTPSLDKHTPCGFDIIIRVTKYFTHENYNSLHEEMHKITTKLIINIR